MGVIPGRTVVYDCEIYRAIPVDGVEREPGIEYCAGWHDFAGLGISCICAWSEWDARSHVYLVDNLWRFDLLAREAEHIVGFNSLCFDDILCASNGLSVKTTFDLLRGVWLATGNPPVYTKGLTRPGYSLGSLAQKNLPFYKTESGETAPVLWQRGECGRVIEYCLTDVAITRDLLRLAVEGALQDPNDGSLITIVLPWSL